MTPHELDEALERASHALANLPPDQREPIEIALALLARGVVLHYHEARRLARRVRQLERSRELSLRVAVALADDFPMSHRATVGAAGIGVLLKRGGKR